MIISLEDAKLIDDTITQADLDGLETAVRRLTNNNFQNLAVRFQGLTFTSDDTFTVKEPIKGLRVGDTLEVNNSLYNDGLYPVTDIGGQAITVAHAAFYEGYTRASIATKVEYPADIATGIKRLLAYDKKMGGKLGIKSESIARMSTTYYDMSAGENTDGYPSSLLSFLKKYEKMRW